jgi:hypothetical protein
MVTVVEPAEKRCIILLALKANSEKRPTYPQMHGIVKATQAMLEEKYGISLGYEFNEIFRGEPWNRNLQNELETYNGMYEFRMESGKNEVYERFDGLSKGAEFITEKGAPVWKILEKQYGKGIRESIEGHRSLL